MDIITGRHNPTFKHLLSLKRSRKVMLLEGRRLVEDAVSRGSVPVMVVLTDEYSIAYGEPAFDHVILSAPLFATISDTETPQGILAFFPMPWADVAEAGSLERLVILDGIQDPGNVGTIIRTSEAFGFHGIILMEGTANPYSPKAIRSSMGSCLGIRIMKGSITALEQLPHRIVSLIPDGRSRISPDRFTGRVALCFGQEASGIRADILRLSSDTVYIPMQGRTESLNVAVTAGIVLACASGALGDTRSRG
ncbi:MAG: TrmH family RNA methyltransferase [Desulfomonilia bacterium]